MTQDLIDIIKKIKEKIIDDSNLFWTGYNTARDLRNELDAYITQLSSGDKNCLEALNMHFLPTSTFQEHSTQNGWTDEYIRLAEQFAHFYAVMKNES